MCDSRENSERLVSDPTNMRFYVNDKLMSDIVTSYTPISQQFQLNQAITAKTQNHAVIYAHPEGYSTPDPTAAPSKNISYGQFYDVSCEWHQAKNNNFLCNITHKSLKVWYQYVPNNYKNRCLDLIATQIGVPLTDQPLFGRNTHVPQIIINLDDHTIKTNGLTNTMVLIIIRGGCGHAFRLNVSTKSAAQPCSPPYESCFPSRLGRIEGEGSDGDGDSCESEGKDKMVKQTENGNDVAQPSGSA